MILAMTRNLSGAAAANKPGRDGGGFPRADTDNTAS